MSARKARAAPAETQPAAPAPQVPPPAATPPAAAAPEAAAATAASTPHADAVRAGDDAAKADGADRAMGAGATVTVVGPAKGRWRAGRPFGPVPVAIPAAELTDDELEALRADPELVVSAT